MNALATHPTSPQALGGPALRAFFAVAQAWQLTDADQHAVLGAPAATVWAQWRAQPEGAVDEATLGRISHVLAIYRALHTLFPRASQADQWMQRPNQALGFAGRTAAQRLSSGLLSELVAVRQYLDSQVNG